MGAAFTSSPVPVGFPAIRGRSLLGVSFFDSDVWVEGTQTRVGLQTQWRPGPFSITSELIRVADNRRGQSPDGTGPRPVSDERVVREWRVGRGRRAQGRPRGHATPATVPGWLRLDPARRAARTIQTGRRPRDGGAVDEPARRSIAGNGEEAMTIGLSWYPNRWIRIDSNLIRETIGDAPQSSYPSLRFWSRLVRLQVSL